MYDCEICGKKTESLYIIDVEGAEMSACQNCAAGKNIIDTLEPESARKPMTNRVVREEPQEELIDNYGAAIRKARDALGIPMHTLAEMINEKESTLNRVEQEKMQPTDALTRKIEKQLGIRLTEIVAPSTGSVKHGKDAPITLGDAAERK